MTPSALLQLHRRIVQCEQCPRLIEHCRLVARQKKRAHLGDTYWGKPVPGFGDPGARLLLVGLAPAAHGANRTGRIFTGDGSGDFLMAALHRAGFANLPTSRTADDGLRLDGAYVVAAVRCAPPDNAPTPGEIAMCRDHLEAEISLLPRVEVVMALGKVAFDAYLQVAYRRGPRPRPRPVFGHGVACEPEYGGPLLLGCYHPSRQNTNTGRLTPAMIDAVLIQARTRLGR